MLDRFIDPQACPLDDRAFIDDCRRRLDEAGVVTIPGFLRPRAIAELVTEAEAAAADAFFTSSTHNVYLTPPDPALGPDHVFNRQITSSKGCITTDQVPAESGLHAIYDSAAFRAFIAEIERLLDEIGIPKGLGEINVPMDCAERISHKALLDSAAGTNPRKATAAEVKEMIETSITGAR